MTNVNERLFEIEKKIEALVKEDDKTSLLEVKRKAEHLKRHNELHCALDELIADFINITGKMPSKTSLMELMNWSFEQTKNPQEIN